MLFTAHQSFVSCANCKSVTNKGLSDKIMSMYNWLDGICILCTCEARKIVFTVKCIYVVCPESIKPINI